MLPTFRETTLWINLVATVVGMGFYFFQLVRLWANGVADPAAALALFIVAVVVIAVIEAVTHILLFVAYRRREAPPADERDRAISLRGNRNAYIVLVIGIWIVIGNLWLPWRQPLVAVNMLLLAFVLAELVRFGSQLIGYRRQG